MLKLCLNIFRMRRFATSLSLKYPINNSRLPQKEFSYEENLFESQYHTHLQDQTTKQIEEIKKGGKRAVNSQVFLSKVNIGTTSIQNLAEIIQFRVKVQKFSEEFESLRPAIAARLSQLVADEDLSYDQMLTLHSCQPQMTRKDYSLLCKNIHKDLECWSISQLTLLLRQINCRRQLQLQVRLLDINEARLFDKLLPRFLKEKLKLYDLILLYDVFQMFFICSLSKRLLIHTTITEIDDLEIYLLQQIDRMTNVNNIMEQIIDLKPKIGAKLMRSMLRQKITKQLLIEGSTQRLKLVKDEQFMVRLQKNFEPGQGLKEWIKYLQSYLIFNREPHKSKNSLVFIRVLTKLSRSNKEIRKYFVAKANEVMKNLMRFKIDDLISLERMKVDVQPMFKILNIDEFNGEKSNPISYLVLLERQTLAHPDGSLDQFVQYAYKIVSRKFRHINSEISLDFERDHDYSSTNHDESYEKLFDIDYFPRLALLLQSLPNPFELESDFTDAYKIFYCSVFRYMGPAQKLNTLKSLYKNIDIDTVLILFKRYCSQFLSLGNELILTLLEFTQNYLTGRNLPQTESLRLFEEMGDFLISAMKKSSNFQKQMKNPEQVLALMDYCLKLIGFAFRNFNDKTISFLESLILFLWIKQASMNSLEIFWRILDKLREHFDVLREGEGKMYLEEIFQKRAMSDINLLDRKEEFEKALVALGGDAYTGFGIVNVAWIQFQPYLNLHSEEVNKRINDLELSRVEQLIMAFRLPMTPTSSQVLNALCLRGKALMETKKETTSNFMPFGRLLRKLLIFADQTPVRQYVKLLLEDKSFQQFTEFVDNQSLCETIVMLKKFGLSETKECKRLQKKQKRRKEYVFVKQLIRKEAIR